MICSLRRSSRMRALLAVTTFSPLKTISPASGSTRRSAGAPGRRLAAAGFADQAEGLAVAHVKRDAVERADGDGARARKAALHREELAQPGDGEDGIRHASSASPGGGAQPAPHLMIGRIGKRHQDRVTRSADRLAQRTARGEAAARGHRADRRNLAGNGGEVARVAIDARNRSQQQLGIGMGRAGEELVHRRDLDDLAGIHRGDAVGDRGDDAEVVGDEDHRHAVGRLELGEEREHLGLDGHVERRRRLVGEQQLRPAGERHRDHHALPHAARELVRVIGKALRAPTGS